MKKLLWFFIGLAHTFLLCAAAGKRHTSALERRIERTSDDSERALLMPDDETLKPHSPEFTITYPAYRVFENAEQESAWRKKTKEIDAEYTARKAQRNCAACTIFSTLFGSCLGTCVASILCPAKAHIIMSVCCLTDAGIITCNIKAIRECENGNPPDEADLKRKQKEANEAHPYKITRRPPHYAPYLALAPTADDLDDDLENDYKDDEKDEV